MSRIFISYKRVDKDKVFKIKEQIESASGENCWIDIDGIESDASGMAKMSLIYYGKYDYFAVNVVK